MRTCIKGALIALIASVNVAHCEPVVAFVGQYTLLSDDDRFGGFSGLEISEDGMFFNALGDRGIFVSGRLKRNGAQIADVETQYLGFLKDTKNRPLAGKFADSEGLAIGKDGQIAVSFENFHRVRSYGNPQSIAATIPPHLDFKNMAKNGSLEALAIDDQGRLYTIPERTDDLSRPYPIYRYENGKWTIPFTIPHIGVLRPVGADFGPDGKFYVLERGLTSVFGFSTRVRRFTISGNKISGLETILETPSGLHGNLEGIAVWRDQSGDIRLTMISDDNFNFFQRTEFVEYRIKE